jgi:hypothetical protein
LPLRIAKGYAAFFILSSTSSAYTSSPATEPEEPNPEPLPAEDVKAGGAAVLPALPHGVHAPSHLRDVDLATFFADPRFNPEQREISHLDMQRAICEVKSARARIELLESAVHLELAEGMSAMRERSEFVEYRRGAPPPPGDGLVTAGEPGEDGVNRLFFFNPDEFPKIYANRTEIQATAELALRRLMELARGRGAAED